LSTDTEEDWDIAKAAREFSEWIRVQRETVPGFAERFDAAAREAIERDRNTPRLTEEEVEANADPDFPLLSRRRVK
jgi:hypothetical protein